jgi:sugar phosphate isomerase/epimerase
VAIEGHLGAVAYLLRDLPDDLNLVVDLGRREVPNWITAPWPNEHSDAHEYQWEEVGIPYWQDLAEHAADHGVQLGIAMHPNMLVYEPHGLLRLREATNEYIGANFEPSHLYWQGIEVIDAGRRGRRSRCGGRSRRTALLTTASAANHQLSKHAVRVATLSR